MRKVSYELTLRRKQIVAFVTNGNQHYNLAIPARLSKKKMLLAFSEQQNAGAVGSSPSPAEDLSHSYSAILVEL